MHRRDFVRIMGGSSLMARSLLRAGGAPLASGARSDAGATILLPSLPYAAPLSEAVLFSFDNRAFPFQNHLETRLIPGENPRVVLRHGPPGSHDEVLPFYGTVIRIENTFHMWYVGNYGPLPDPDFYELENYVLCYATSNDGVHWEKPELGLVEYNGSKKNNICQLDAPTFYASGAVLYEPEDPDPNRRFKLAYEAGVPVRAEDLGHHPRMRLHVAFSPDGLRWKNSPKNPVGPFQEMTCVTKFRGLYYVNGHVETNAHSKVGGRRLDTFVSEDFELWSPCAALGLDRSPDLTGPSTAEQGKNAEGEQIHMGAALWNRGNVFVAIYGQWHGHFSGDRRLAVIDLGFALSHDALHFYEPIPGFRYIAAEEQPESTKAVFPALMQGQGMENFGDQTLYWYSVLPIGSPQGLGIENSGVRMVTWPQDRLGMLRPFLPADARAISCPIQLTKEGAKLFINASGLGQYSYLHVGLLTQGFRPIPGYSDSDAVDIREGHLRFPVRWKSGYALPISAGPLRIDIRFEGVRPEDAALHAAYVTSS
jgi:hypothetical protein